MRRITCFLLLILSSSSFADPRFELIPGSRYLSAAGSAIGDAYFGFVSDVGDSLFYNPAGLGQLRGKHIEPLNFTLGANTGFFANAGIRSLGVFNLGSYAGTLAGNESVSGGIYPNAGFRFGVFTVAFGALFHSRLQAILLADGTVRNRSRYELAPTLGLGVRIAGGILRLGYSLAWVNRVDGDVTAASPTSWNQGLSQGSGFSHTASAAITLPWALLPSVTFTARNILNTQYVLPVSLLRFASGSPGAPTDDPMSLDAAFSIQPKFGRGTMLNLALAYRDLVNASGATLLDHLTLGSELIVRERFAFRLGLTGADAIQGYVWPSAGVGLKTKRSELNFSWFSEEIGSAAAPLRDQRFMFQYKLGFN